MAFCVCVESFGGVVRIQIRVDVVEADPVDPGCVRVVDDWCKTRLERGLSCAILARAANIFTVATPTTILVNLALVAGKEGTGLIGTSKP